MDLLKVFDLTVREIKREVNLKVLKVPKIEQNMLLNVLWTRLGETGKDWRYVYKSLTGFEYVEPNGKDVVINVRKKAKTIVGLLNNKEKIEEVRNKAASTHDKYIGLSSTGMASKSSAAAFGSSSF